jgi:hypothetical protein
MAAVLGSNLELTTNCPYLHPPFHVDTNQCYPYLSAHLELQAQSL